MTWSGSWASETTAPCKIFRFVVQRKSTQFIKVVMNNSLRGTRASMQAVGDFRAALLHQNATGVAVRRKNVRCTIFSVTQVKIKTHDEIRRELVHIRNGGHARKLVFTLRRLRDENRPSFDPAAFSLSFHARHLNRLSFGRLRHPRTRLRRCYFTFSRRIYVKRRSHFWRHFFTENQIFPVSSYVSVPELSVVSPTRWLTQWVDVPWLTTQYYPAVSALRTRPNSITPNTFLKNIGHDLYRKLVDRCVCSIITSIGLLYCVLN